MAGIKDVAREAGVSASTVSYVLSGKRSISAKTTGKVMAAVEKLGYTPDASARKMRGMRNQIIALSAPIRGDINQARYNAYFLRTAWAARNAGYDVMLLTGPDAVKDIRRVTQSNQMNEIAEGNLDARIEVNSTDEIGEVGASFNVMAKRLQENIVEMVEQEKREQQLKYGLMISQVDPHFIYNTMNMITYLAQKNRNEDVIAVNKAMIQILRDRLRIEVDNVYDTVEQEIKVVREYLLIQKYRYTGIFKSVIDIEAGVEPYLIAKNILQPLVENAFFHGILCNTDEEGEVIDGCITIRIRMEEDEVEIIVKDNGAGMSQDKLDELSKPQRKLSSMERGEHIGIKNIKERLDYIYENKYRFQIWSKEGEGTIVTIRIPAIVSSETEK